MLRLGLARSPAPERLGRTAAARRDCVFQSTLAVADVAGAYVALTFAIAVVGGEAIHLRPGAALLAPFVVVVSKVAGLYDRDQYLLRKTTIDELPTIFSVSVCYALGVWLADEVVLRGRFGRAEVVGLALASFAFVALGRSGARCGALALTPAERCVVIGDGAAAIQTASKLTQSPGVKAVVVGRVALRAEDPTDAGVVPTVGDLTTLGRVAVQCDVDRFVVAPESGDQEQAVSAIRLVKALGVKVSVVPGLLEVAAPSSVSEEIEGVAFLGVRRYGLTRSSAMLKRSLDIMGAAAGLVAMSPLWLCLAVAVKVDSRGPVLFRQPRIGRRGTRFEMLKFRSMVADADGIKEELRPRNEAQGGLFKIRDDPRITRVGRFLRRTSLDELPQLINVLIGEMSLVGPRPLVPAEDALIEGWHRRRLAVKPGMTGVWQVLGSARIPLHEMVTLDYVYCANWSLGLDLKILLRTIPYVLGRRGL